MLAEEVATIREQLAAAETAAAEGAVAASRAARLSNELQEAHAEIRRLSELEGVCHTVCGEFPDSLSVASHDHAVGTSSCTFPGAC